ncbi:SET domain-containing protein 9 [Corythoichthys intestinalis]|uniref:SET domain-containing protein 9 n=1 Tax=Corythoichthys intestinalis TaxID=161448 RepID=UPI0025A4CCEB|nr:SET domain-containing protein 9 [Corythoichthys intestinalis]XP_061794781.1 SET domain-containing protein 9-like [Nerophis lumbriciformis]
MFRKVLEGFRFKWKSYRHRFLPWIVLNISKNEKTLRQVKGRAEDKLVPDEEVSQKLVRLFRDLYGADRRVHSHEQVAGDGDKARRGHDAMFRTFGFCIDRKPSTLPFAGTGVFITKGFVPRGATVAMYPGTIYQTYEPIFLQSIRNPFVFRCIDGVLVDGKDKGISKMVYKSCSGRDRMGPLAMSDSSWLTAAPQNPLAVGQYVNNCSDERPANVCYQELDVPDAFPVELRRYLPNVNYGPDSQRPLRCVVLVSLRDIRAGEELFSNYYTIVH